MKLPPITLTCFWLLGPVVGQAAAQQLMVSDLTQSGNQITITIRNTGASTSFRVDGSPTMAAGTWGTVVGATFAPVSGQPGFFRTTFTRTGVGKQFYRVVGLASVTSPDDPDGDGLTTTFEATLGTNSSLLDTDGDGFSDGQEFTLGSNPLVNSSRPVLATKPAVEFEELTATGVEGSPYLARITLDKPFTGTVKYAVVPANSTAVAPGDYTAPSGTVSVNGTSANIPITWTDDATVKGDRMLALDIVALGTDGYRTGGRSRHVIRLEDNDWYWNGAAQDTYAQRNFRIRLTRNGAASQVAFVAGAGNDGLPLTVVGDTTSQTEGLVPVGTFPGTVQFNTPTHFRVTSPAMPLPVATSGITAGVTDFTRTLVLDSLPAVGSFHEITTTRIAGNYTETLASVSSPHLNRTITGMFVIARDIPTPVPARAAQ
jgi:hypothetical protein